MSNNESFLKFNKHSIEDFTFKRNYDFTESEDVKLEIDFSADVDVSEDSNEATVRIKCVIFDEDFNDNKSPFYLNSTIRGEFSCHGEYNIEDFQLHGMAILLPYLRSFITSFTSQAGIPPVILPAINAHKFFQKEE